MFLLIGHWTESLNFNRCEPTINKPELLENKPTEPSEPSEGKRQAGSTKKSKKKKVSESHECLSIYFSEKNVLTPIRLHL